MAKRKKRPNPWPDDLPADVQVALDALLEQHPHIGERLIDDLMARQEPLDSDSLPRLEGPRLEAERKDPGVLALAEVSQSAYRQHAHPLDDLLAVSEKHLVRIRGYKDGILEYLHSMIMNGFSDGQLADENGARAAFDRMEVTEPAALVGWPLTLEEIVDLTNNHYILRYSEMGGPPTYEAFPDTATFNAAWAELEEEYDPEEPNEPEEDDLVTNDHITWRWAGRSGPRSFALRVSGDDDWRAAVRAWMAREGFSPNVWFISDHGNAHLLNVFDEDED